MVVGIDGWLGVFLLVVGFVCWLLGLLVDCWLVGFFVGWLTSGADPNKRDRSRMLFLSVSLTL